MKNIIEELEWIILNNPKLNYMLSGSYNARTLKMYQGYKIIRSYDLTTPTQIINCVEELRNFKYENK